MIRAVDGLGDSGYIYFGPLGSLSVSGIVVNVVNAITSKLSMFLLWNRSFPYNRGKKRKSYRSEALCSIGTVRLMISKVLSQCTARC